MNDLRKHHGLLTTDPWRIALSRIPDDQKRYISACLRKGETLESKPRITISTIHRAKGAQATNVLMTTDVPKRKSMLWRQEEFDDEARVFYVGLTRAKKALHLIHPMRSAGYAIPHGETCSPAA
jgi:superfamily I DNA/RNA helicase